MFKTCVSSALISRIKCNGTNQVNFSIISNLRLTNEMLHIIYTASFETKGQSVLTRKQTNKGPERLNKKIRMKHLKDKQNRCLEMLNK